MAIDIATEKVVSFKEAMSHLPEQRAGKHPDIATLYRWTVVGCRGIRLESIMVGAAPARRSEAARFFDRLTEAAAPAPRLLPPLSSPKADGARSRPRRMDLRRNPPGPDAWPGQYLKTQTPGQFGAVRAGVEGKEERLAPAQFYPQIKEEI